MKNTLISFLQHLQLEKRYANHTIQAYRNDLEQYGLYLRTTYTISQYQDAQHTHIRSWAVCLLEQNISNASINRKLSTLKTFYKYAMKRGLITINPMNKVVMPKTGKRLPTFLSKTNIAILFQNVDFGESYAGSRNRLILETLYATGMRRAELIALKLSDLDLTQCRFRVFGKGSKERLIPFTNNLQQLLEQYTSLRNDTFPENQTPNLFLTDKGKPLYPKMVYNIVNRYLSEITTQDKRSPHVLRHTFATHITENGGDLNAVKKLLGHSSLASTQVYTHNSIDKLKHVYQQAHPKATKKK